MTHLTEKYINPFTDYGFKRIFGEEPNKALLKDFLNELLRDEQGEIVELQYLNSEKLGLTQEDRKSFFDIYCTNEKGDKFIVELQKSKQKYFKERALYYSTFPIIEQAKRGSDWNFELNAVYTIAILDFTFDDDEAEDKYLYNVKLTEQETKKVFYDKLTFIYLAMPNFTKTLVELETHFDKWLYIFKNLHRLQEIPTKLQEEIFLKLFDVAEVAQFTRDEYRDYEASLKSYWDLNSVMSSKLEEGIEIGEQNKAFEIAKKMKAKGFDIQDIIEMTNLSSIEINKLS
ncbi:MAG: PD-(D/E)XK nuclease family transposase [Moraxellaceae bacterium]|nr:PD-(D/E)XK nuclease family transposase [Moraxellaceae bacterium]